MAFAPGYVQLQAIKILHHHKFLASRQIVPPSFALLARGMVRHHGARNAQ